jgi:hypothetical protein
MMHIFFVSNIASLNRYMSLGTSIKLCRAFVMCACFFTRCFVLEGAPGRKLLLYLWGYFQRWRRSGAKPMRAHYHFPEPHTQELGMVWLERMKQFLCWTISHTGKKLNSVHLAFTYQALWMGWLLYTLCTYGGKKRSYPMFGGGFLHLSIDWGCGLHETWHCLARLGHSFLLYLNSRSRV